MTVRSILDEKGRDVFTMRPTITLAEAAQVLAQKRIGALILVDESGEIAGILSERDVVRMIGTKGPECLSESVADVMTLKVLTCTEDATLHQVMDTMTRGRFRHLPVVRDGRLIGIVSIGDVVKRRIEDAERDAEEMRTYISAA